MTIKSVVSFHTRTIDNLLARVDYTFLLIDEEIVLDKCVINTKNTTASEYKISKSFDRVCGNNPICKCPPPSLAVLSTAKDEIISQIKFSSNIPV